MSIFLEAPEGEPYRKRFKGLTPGTSKFTDVYLKIAKENPDAFESAQKAFIVRTHYVPAIREARNLGFNVNDRGIQEAIFSRSNQQGAGGAKRLLRRTVGEYPLIKDMSSSDQLSAMYAQHSRDIVKNNRISSSAGVERSSRELTRTLRISNLYQMYYYKK